MGPMNGIGLDQSALNLLMTRWGFAN